MKTGNNTPSKGKVMKQNFKEGWGGHKFRNLEISRNLATEVKTYVFFCFVTDDFVSSV